MKMLYSAWVVILLGTWTIVSSYPTRTTERSYITSKPVPHLADSRLSAIPEVEGFNSNEHDDDETSELDTTIDMFSIEYYTATSIPSRIITKTIYQLRDDRFSDIQPDERQSTDYAQLDESRFSDNEQRDETNEYYTNNIIPPVTVPEELYKLSNDRFHDIQIDESQRHGDEYPLYEARFSDHVSNG